MELWESMFWSNGCWSLCWFNLVCWNNHSWSGYRHFESTIKSKRNIDPWSIHSWHNARSESHLFSLMLHSTRHNHQLRFGRKSKDYHIRRKRILFIASRNCSHCIGCRSFDYYNCCNYLGDCLLLQKTSKHTWIARISKSQWKRTCHIITMSWSSIVSTDGKVRRKCPNAVFVLRFHFFPIWSNFCLWRCAKKCIFFFKFYMLRILVSGFA